MATDGSDLVYIDPDINDTSDANAKVEPDRKNRAALFDKNKKGHLAKFSLPVDIRLVTDMVLNLADTPGGVTGFGPEFVGNWKIEDLTIRFGQTGGTTDISLYQCLLNYPVASSPATSIPPTPDPTSSAPPTPESGSVYNPLTPTPLAVPASNVTTLPAIPSDTTGGPVYDANGNLLGIRPAYQ